MSDNPKSIFPEILAWYAQLHTGDRAQLRRCQQAQDAIYFEPYHHLRFRLKRDMKEKWSERALPHLACLLAHVKKNIGKAQAEDNREAAMPLGKALANADYSVLRFRRLINNDNRDDLFIPLMRAIGVLKGHVDVVDLAKTVLWWNDQTRRRLATDYYQHKKISQKEGA